MKHEVQQNFLNSSGPEITFMLYAMAGRIPLQYTKITAFVFY